MILEELTTYALVTASVIDAVQSAPIKAVYDVSVLGVGTPPQPVDPGLLWPRVLKDQFVIVADAAAVPLDSASSSTPPPQHVVNTFSLHLHLSAPGYTPLDAFVNVTGGATIPIKPPPYALSPLAVALRGRVMLQGPPLTPLAGATVSVTATVPPVPLPPPVTADANGFYVLLSLPLVRSLTVHAASGPHNGSQTITLDYGSPTDVANFTLT